MFWFNLGKKIIIHQNKLDLVSSSPCSALLPTLRIWDLSHPEQHQHPEQSLPPTWDVTSP